MNKRFFCLAAALVLLSFSAVTLNAAGSSGNTVTFDNKSGEDALVKLVDSSGGVQSVPVTNGLKSTIENVSYGKHYIKVRYGTPGNYRYSKGDSFMVNGDGYSRRSRITITLHKVVNGNYHTQRMSPSEF